MAYKISLILCLKSTLDLSPFFVTVCIKNNNHIIYETSINVKYTLMCNFIFLFSGQYHWESSAYEEVIYESKKEETNVRL
jgi:hypothetical protein